LLDGFARERIGTLNLVRGGAGPPLLLLHGFPQTHVAWHRVAPRLAERFTVVAADLPGYGDSAGPEPDPAHTAYSKRATAATLVEAMRTLGFPRFAVAGHDRGARVAYRMALDHPDRVSRLAVLDVIPTLESAERVDRAFGLTTYHWFFLAQPPPFPERLIGGDPEFFLDHTLGSWLGRPDGIEAAARDEYRRCFRQPGVIRASCEDYRAGLSVDLEHDRADRAAGRRIACPLLVLWSATDDWKALDPLAVWRGWAERVDGGRIDSGHFLMEEAPDATTAALLRFFTDEKT
jgi:haloacetate dehalogenase